MKTYCEFTFEAAHSVAPYSGLHGHTFIVKLTFGGAVDEVYGWPVNLYEVENYIKEITATLISIPRSASPRSRTSPRISGDW